MSSLFRCDVCLEDDSLVASSPQLLPLLLKHLRITLRSDVLICGPCSQLITLWDQFSTNATKNFLISHPETKQIQFVNLDADDLDTGSSRPDNNAGIACYDLTDQDTEHATPTACPAVIKPHDDNDSLVLQTLQSILQPDREEQPVQHIESPAHNNDEEPSPDTEGPQTDIRSTELIHMESPELSNDQEPLKSLSDTEEPSQTDIRSTELVQATIHYPRYSCSFCNKKFMFLKSLRLHVKVTHGSHSEHQMKTCPSCQVPILIKHFQFHLIKHHTSCSQDCFYHCICCPKLFTQRASLICHFKKHCQVLKCKVCGEIFNSKSNLGEHMNKQHANCAMQSQIITVTPEISEKCNKKVKTKLTCNFCCKIYKNKTSLVHHISNHLQEKTNNVAVNSRLKCKHCLQVFTLKKNLDLHIRDNHLSDTSVALYFPCSFCDKVLASITILQAHMRKYHSGNKKEQLLVDRWLKKSGYCMIKLRCYVCNQAFSNKHGLRIHISKMHSSSNTIVVDKKKSVDDNTDSQLKCNICGKACLNQKGLNLHMAKMHKK